MKYLLLVLVFCSSAFSLDFYVIEVTDNQPFNYFFSYLMTILFISLPLVALLDFLKRLDK